MADPWELICHHTYSGIPGVVIDRSPLSASDASVFNVPDEDFLPDGAREGSGAVRFPQGTLGSLRISGTSPPWRLLEGLRAEVTVRREPAHKNFIFDSNAFQFYVRNDSVGDGELYASFVNTAGGMVEISSVNDPIGPDLYAVPRDRWVTLGFVYDGFGKVELLANGTVVARKIGLVDMLRPIAGAGVSIGCSLAGNDSFQGEVDEVKIWRLNPRRHYDDFHSRPMGPKTAACWRKFDEDLQAALRRYPECAERVSTDLRNALRAALWEIVSDGPASVDRFSEAVQEYQRLWREGKVGTNDMTECVAGLIEWLEAAGLDGVLKTTANELVSSDCFQIISSEVPTPECDRQFAHLVTSVASRLSARDQKSPKKL